MSQSKTITRRSLSFVAARGLVLALAASVGAASVTACGGPKGNERWVATEDTTVEIDWDAINQAYKDAEGPEDFERRVNEIYEGEEIISVSVKDLDDKTQVVTGFFDKDEDGAIADGEKVFTIQRDIVDPNKAQYAISGHGAYGSYHSPMWDIASGMLMGSMLSRMFMPGYSPMYSTPYTTSARLPRRPRLPARQLPRRQPRQVRQVELRPQLRQQGRRLGRRRLPLRRRRPLRRRSLRRPPPGRPQGRAPVLKNA
jgi:hypothetical protein